MFSTSSPLPAGAPTTALTQPIMRKAAKPLEAEEFPNAKPEDEWKKELNGSEYRMLRQQGTEAPGRGEYHTFFPQEGFFGCRACKFPLVRRLVSKSLTKSARIP